MSKYAFLAKKSSYIVYFTFLLAVIVNIPLSIYYLQNKSWWLFVLSIFSIFVFPKAILCIILLLGRNNSLVLFNMSKLICKLFPRVIKRYSNTVSYSGDRLENNVINTLIWLLIGLCPLIFFFQGY